MEFTKKYWQEHADSSVKDSEVGDALDEWQRHCKEPKEFTSYDHFDAALQTVHKLTSALDKAKKKTSDKNTLKLIAEYESAIEKYRLNVGSEYHERVLTYTKSRKRLLDTAQQKSEAFQRFVERAETCLHEVERYEATAAEANGPGLEHMWKRVHELIPEMGALQRNMDVYEARTKKSMVDMKGDNPVKHGVIEKDTKEASEHMLKATDLMNVCTNHQKQMTHVQIAFKDASEAVLGIVSGQRKDLSESLAAARKSVQEADGAATNLESSIGSAERASLPSLRQMSQASAVSKTDLDGAGFRLSNLKNAGLNLANHKSVLARAVKNFARFSQAYQADQEMQALAKQMTGIEARADAALRHFDEVLGEAARYHDAITHKPIAASARK